MKNFEVKLNKVRFEYKFIRTIDVGIVLKGNEVKGVKSKEFSFVDAYCFFKGGELFVKNLLISESKSHFTHDPKRDKKLLLKKRELNKIQGKLVKGLSLIPTLLLTNERGLIKLEIILGRGKKLYDKRESIKKKDLERRGNV